MSSRCPCCRKPSQSPRVLGCLHSVCSPCMDKVEAVLRELDRHTRSPLRPLGRFLCPQCNSCHLVSRLGVSVLPQLDRQAHQQGGLGETVGKVLSEAGREVSQQLRIVEGNIKRLRTARDKLGGERQALNKEVVSFYQSYRDQVASHRRGLEDKISKHFDLTNHLLLREELQLEQARTDLGQLGGQVQHLTALQDQHMVTRLLVPLVSRLQAVTDLAHQRRKSTPDKMHFQPGLNCPDTRVPGLLATWAVCPARSQAVIDRKVYEKAECRIHLHLADDNGVKLAVNRDPGILARLEQEEEVIRTKNGEWNNNKKFDKIKTKEWERTITSEEKTSNIKQVEVKLEYEEEGQWSLVFTPPCPGPAYLTVTIGGVQIKNSPYILQVQSLGPIPNIVDNVTL